MPVVVATRRRNPVSRLFHKAVRVLTAPLRVFRRRRRTTVVV